RPEHGTKDTPLTLTPEQQTSYDAMAPFAKDGGFGTHLLLGVTGSGKTEVYLRLMADVVAAGRQAVMLVPEIALTPQTVRRITARFDRVAVLHSGLTPATRHRYWQQIAAGKADVVVGARSAVFAPVPNLGLLVVDEEHESSYKQDQVPRYHARDVAIKRAQMAGCPVVLGSATPSLESYQRAKSASDPHHLHLLSRRVAERAMPAIEIQDMKLAQRLRTRKGIHLLSPRLEQLIEHTKEQGQQSILLLNRRGYANFVYNAQTDEPVTCKYCDATMTYHRSAGEQVMGGTIDRARHTGQLHCHYCLAVDTLDAAAERTGGHLSLFGLGTQRVEEELRRKFPRLVFERVDSDTMRSSKDYENVLRRFADGAIDMLMGTQMIAKGLDFPNVSLVGVVSGDTALALPDFRAAERTFQLITQVAGRAGRGEIPGRVVLQTFSPNDDAIVLALKQDYPKFADRELGLRREVGLPPFGRMVRIVLRDQDEEKVIAKAEQLAGIFADVAQQVGSSEVQGPMPAAIGRIAG
ncbi:MAG: primosomal protein N', partial [Planctomycetota bacterium]